MQHRWIVIRQRSFVFQRRRGGFDFGKYGVFPTGGKILQIFSGSCKPSLSFSQQDPRGGDQNCDKMAVIFWLTNYRFGNLIVGIELVY
jgi:hypothetical protein